MDSSLPPLEQTFTTLFGDLIKKKEVIPVDFDPQLWAVHDHELPIMDLSRLTNGSDRRECVREIGEAAKEWGFLHVMNHGVSPGMLERVKQEQEKLFRQPFNKKSTTGGAGDLIMNNYDSNNNNNCMNLSSKQQQGGCLSYSYRWGTPTAKSVMQFSWSEAFHIPLSQGHRNTSSSRSAMDEFAVTVSKLAQVIAGVLAENLGKKSDIFVENCLPSSCFLRLNRYPPCPFFSNQVHGLVPHTDSDFITILYQDSLGGLQLVKDGAWIGVKPNPDALIINIGDLFQAWSNGVYKSIQHRVVTNGEKERFSIAYFMCPSYDTVIQSCSELYPPIYKKFTFGDYRKKVEEDVKSTGSKTGLLKFLVSSSTS